MAYSKTTWINGASPAINATNLNKIETGIYDIDAIVTDHTSTLANLSSTVGSHTTSISTLNSTTSDHESRLDTAEGDIDSIQDDITAIYTNGIIMRTGTFTGSWSPTFTTTFSIAGYNDYNWILNVKIPNWTISNGAAVACIGTISGDNITMNATIGGTGVAGNYNLIGVKKTLSSFAVVDEA